RDVVLAQRAATPQAIEDIVEPVAQAVEHRELSLHSADRPARETRGPAASPTNGDGEVGLILLPKGARTLQAGPTRAKTRRPIGSGNQRRPGERLNLNFRYRLEAAILCIRYLRPGTPIADRHSKI